MSTGFPDTQTAGTPLGSSRKAWLAVSVLLLIYIFSFIDRQILTLLVNPIQQDFGIGDFEMGCCLGPRLACSTLFAACSSASS
jgi:hypothetical protein